MTNREFLRRIDSFGVGRPDTQNGDFWVKLLHLKPSGSGNPRNYTQTHVRVIVAWQTILQLCGKDVTQNDLHHDAAWEMADHESGWVVITDGMVGWTQEPSPSVFVGGATCIPVPAW